MLKVFILGFFLAFNAFAEHAGSGAAGVVCYREGKISSVELLDLYEARLKGLTIQSHLTDNFEQAAKLALIKIDELDRLGDVVKFKKTYRPIREGQKLTIVQDQYPLMVPKGCEIQQISFIQNHHTVWFDSYLYKFLDAANRHAVILHDFLYRDSAMVNKVDSRYTRTIVGHIFSTGHPFDLYLDVMGYEEDMNVTCFDREEKVVLYAKKVPSHKNLWKFNFSFLNGHQMFTKTSGVFEVAYDLIQPPAGARVISTAHLESKIHPFETLSVETSEEGIFLSWKGTYPGDEFERLPLHCERLWITSNDRF